MGEASPVFYFTIHPVDMTRRTIIAGSRVMIVASAFWDQGRQRFKIRRPPADHVGTVTIDSGGFTAAKRWGRYPWTHQQYIDFIRAESRDIRLGFAACMDYACEREVNRETYATNVDRIRATIENEIILRRLAPDLPWLGVLQGNTLQERMFDVRCRRRLGLIWPLMGVGSICGRGARQAREVLRFYRRVIPNTMLHAFGLDVRTMDSGEELNIASWDSYAWCWARGKKGRDAPSFLVRGPGETQSSFTLRMAKLYQEKTVDPRISQARQMILMEAP